jgi:hypothetical protein
LAAAFLLLAAGAAALLFRQYHIYYGNQLWK